MEFSNTFIENIQAAYGQEGKTWLSHLPNHIDQLSKQWNFQLIHPMSELSYHFVAVVQLQNGLAVLKTGPTSAPLMAEAAWLKAHKKRVPIVFDTDQKNNAFLMEKLQPGNSLKSLVKDGNDEEATRIISQVILDLQKSAPLHPMQYHHISEHASALAFLHGHIDRNIIESGESIFSELCIDRSNDIVLHGDLHHDNILQSNHSWSVIDPHGYIGDPCAEVGTMIYNPLDCFPDYHSMQNIIETRLNIFAEMLPFDMQRMKAWSFCLALRSAAWDIEGFGHPNAHTIEIAKTLYSIL